MEFEEAWIVYVSTMPVPADNYLFLTDILGLLGCVSTDKQYQNASTLRRGIC